MEGKTIFFIVWCIVVVFILTTFYLKGKKALSIFPDIDDDDIKFRDKRASGYSTKSFKTKMGGARKVLDIIVTNDELWLKSRLLFAFVSKKNDLLHRIPFNNIKSIAENGKTIIIDFTSADTGDNKQVVILTKKHKNFLSAVKTVPSLDINFIDKLDKPHVSGIAKKQKYILIASLFVVCGIIVFFQYNSQKEKHERLASIGQVVPITSQLYKAWDVDYANYYFITKQGKKIEGHEKCGKEYYKYVVAIAIYNPNNPTEYELSFNYGSYYPRWRIIFFFFIYLPAMVFVTYGFINFGITIYKAIKR